MLKYKLYSLHPGSGFIDIEAEFTANENEKYFFFQLPVWRPGRYETADFAKNIRELTCEDEKQRPLDFQKVEKSKWKVILNGANKLKIKYRFFANTMNAGSSFVSPELFYVNPVNCIVYPVQFNDEESIKTEIILPSKFNLITAEKCTAKKSNTNTNYQINYNNIHEFFDSPFIASEKPEIISFTSGKKEISVALIGKNNLDEKQIEKDFKKFADFQFSMFGGFPFSSYVFIFICLPYEFYHGVEHLKSTVIAIGPGERLKEKELYDEVLGVSSHELFHCWNIKTIRPAEMFPYDYQKPNYSKLGYIYEGVTTYYGDLILLRSGVFNLKDYFEQLNLQLKKHFDNTGRFNYSVAESSFDTWLDGYVPGIPGRKVSIYTEGCLLAFCMDIFIIHYSRLKFSLDDVWKEMNKNFGKLKKGYTEKDYLKILQKFCPNYHWKSFFEKYINGKHSFLDILKEAANYSGLLLSEQDIGNYLEKHLGILCEIKPDGSILIKEVIAEGNQFENKFSVGEQIVSCNGKKTFFDINQEIKNAEILSFVVKSVFSSTLRNVDMQLPLNKRENFNLHYSISVDEKADDLQKKVFDFWISKRNLNFQ